MGGKVTKPKIQAYVDQDVYDWFKGFCDGRKLNQSQGLNLALFKLMHLIEFDSADVSASVSAVDTNKISEIEKRLELLEEVFSKFINDLESLNNLCKFSFEIAFNRIGRLERGEKVNDLGLDQSTVTIPDAQLKITQAKLLADDIKLNQQDLADRLKASERSLQRWKMKSESEFNEWLGKHEPVANLIWKPIPNTTLFQAALKPLPLENSFGDPVDPSLEYRYNAAIKAIEELHEISETTV